MESLTQWRHSYSSCHEIFQWPQILSPISETTLLQTWRLGSVYLGDQNLDWAHRHESLASMCHTLIMTFFLPHMFIRVSASVRVCAQMVLEVHESQTGLILCQVIRMTNSRQWRSMGLWQHGAGTPYIKPKNPVLKFCMSSLQACGQSESYYMLPL